MTQTAVLHVFQRCAHGLTLCFVQRAGVRNLHVNVGLMHDHTQWVCFPGQHSGGSQFLATQSRATVSALTRVPPGPVRGFLQGEDRAAACVSPSTLSTPISLPDLWILCGARSVLCLCQHMVSDYKVCAKYLLHFLIFPTILLGSRLLSGRKWRVRYCHLCRAATASHPQSRLEPKPARCHSSWLT